MQLIDSAERWQQRTGLQRRFSPAAYQLEDLNDKFDLTNTARAELDVVLQATATHLAGNHPFHISQGLDHAEVNVAAEHERAQHGAQLVGVGIVAVAHDPRFDHRVTLPVAPLLLVIIFQRGKAQHQWPAVAKRTQTHIHAVDKTILGGLIQRLNQPLPQAGKELGVVQLATTAARGAVLRPGKNQVDV